ncbi:hypothetical protein SBOR_7717 [Sclerotinia borealis F-4128]|uniref:Uncharacterized protein n=1 Tax=Sclerotinia borealis (strain F-4128) TaxID=1432307 RepID=W9C565_SCLBF|nr:hypothetical protein SBOR_7717 [Sclerotinia borealis F-4128]
MEELKMEDIMEGKKLEETMEKTMEEIMEETKMADTPMCFVCERMISERKRSADRAQRDFHHQLEKWTWLNSPNCRAFGAFSPADIPPAPTAPVPRPPLFRLDPSSLEECMLCLRSFCEWHKSEETNGICQINHATYCRKHPEIPGIFPSMADLERPKEKKKERQKRKREERREQENKKPQREPAQTQLVMR